MLVLDIFRELPPTLIMAPPESAVLFLRTLSVRVSVPELKMAPPSLSTRPLRRVRPEILTVIPIGMLKMRKFGVPPATLRCTVRMLAPGPLMLKLLFRSGSALANEMSPLMLGSKVIVSSPAAAFASWIAARKVH